MNSIKHKYDFMVVNCGSILSVCVHFLFTIGSSSSSLSHSHLRIKCDSIIKVYFIKYIVHIYKTELDWTLIVRELFGSRNANVCLSGIKFPALSQCSFILTSRPGQLNIRKCMVLVLPELAKSLHLSEHLKSQKNFAELVLYLCNWNIYCKV